MDSITQTNRLVLWINKEPSQVALACKIINKFDVIGIVFESRPHKRKISFKKIIEKIIEKLTLKELDIAWQDMQYDYENQFPSIPNDIPYLEVENINKQEVIQFTKNLKADLIIVSGTSLIKKHMFQLELSKGMMNLHTGLSPYIKGGPNCTNWCFAINKPELIGNTVMWLDEGIDSGKIISTEKTVFNHKPTFSELHQIVMEHAHQLYIRSIGSIVENKKIPGIDQNDIGIGITYYTKNWTLNQKRKALNNFKNWQPTIVDPKLTIKTIPLPN